MPRSPAAPLALVTLLVACAAGPSPSPTPAAAVYGSPGGGGSPGVCPAGDTALERDELFFGRNRKGGPEVSDGEWRDFLSRVVTPRFPAGFTVWEARGQWRGADGAIEEENSKVLAIFHAPDAASRAAVDSVVTAYRAAFAQEAVLRARTPACVGFGT